MIFIAAVVAVSLRLPHLNMRPMHTDEAVHAIKFGQLLEDNYYQYDRNEYHGPTLNYFSLIAAKLSSVSDLAATTESTLRIVPVFFGVLLVLMFMPAAKGLGGGVAAIASILVAVSPAMVFYSRYYIQEILLVCFTFGLIVCGYRYTKERRIKWTVFAGLFAGLMHATKETCIIAFAAMVAAGILTLIWSRLIDREEAARNFSLNPLHVLIAVFVSVAVSVLFYSSFFSNPQGVVDSLVFYKTYFDRASGNMHIHPWYYYLKTLLFFKFGDGPAQSEAFIIILALFGSVVALTKKGFAVEEKSLLRFITFFTFVTIIVYSAIPYKTPWCILSSLGGMIIVAAAGIVGLLSVIRQRFFKVALCGIFLAGILHLASQSCDGSFKYYADPANPYVYAHTHEDVPDVAAAIEEITGVWPDGFDTYIQAIFPEDDYWPFPWYLREFERVAYQSEVTDEFPAAAVIIFSPSVQAELMAQVNAARHTYVSLFNSYKQLRPALELRVLVRKDLWENYQQYKVDQILQRTAGVK